MDYSVLEPGALEFAVDSSRTRTPSRVLRWWTFLIATPTSRDPEEDLRARFLAAVLLLLFPFACLFGLGAAPCWVNAVNPTSTLVFRAAFGALGGMVASYALNRSGQRHAASILTVCTLVMAVLVSGWERAQLLVFLSLPILLSVAVLPRGWAAFFGAVGLSFHALLWGLSPESLWEILIPFTLNTCCLAVGMVLREHLADLEMCRFAHLQGRERWFATTLASIGDGVLTVDPRQAVTFLNPVAEKLTGWSLERARGVDVSKVFCLKNAHVPRNQGLPARQPASLSPRQLLRHAELIDAKGAAHSISHRVAPILDATGRLYGEVRVFRDVSEEEQLLEQFEQAQRLNSLGHFAGGVAHDFNNLLTAITGCTHLALEQLQPGSDGWEELVQVGNAAERAAALTAQLLAFSGRQVLKIQTVDLKELVAAAQRVLRQFLRDQVELRTDLAEEILPVSVDPPQLQQAIVNLAMNAHDAMPQGGVITVSTSAIVTTEGEPFAATSSGRFGRIRIADTGRAIAKADLPRIFEPFFTSTNPGRRNGLRLATAHGIVHQSGGTLTVHRSTEHGTEFDVLLPIAVSQLHHPEPAAPCPSSESRRVGEVFLAEDDAAVRRTTARILRHAGFTVTSVNSGDAAIAQLDSLAAAPSILITDVMMPGRNGTEVARAFRRRFAAAPVLFISGYSDETIAHEGLALYNSAYLAKPFTPKQLLSAISLLRRTGSEAIAPQPTVGASPNRLA